MTDESKKLLAIAQKQADNFWAKQKEQLHALSVVGSVAYGISDKYSDIDFFLLYKNAQDILFEDIRKEGSSPETLYIVGGEEYEFITIGKWLGNIKIDFAHIAAGKFEASIDAVLNKHDMALEHQAALFGIQYSTVFYEEGLISDWRKRIAVYPQELKINSLKKSLSFNPKSVYYGMGLYRNDDLLVRELLIDDLQKVIRIVFALNEVYHPGKMKGLEWIVKKHLSIQPASFWERIEKINNSICETACDLMMQLIADTIDLVKQQDLEIDIDGLTKRHSILLRKEED